MISYLLSFFFKHNLRGKDRLYSYIRKNNLNHHIRKKTATGILMKLDPKNYVDSSILNTGGYELEVVEELGKDVVKEDVFWDIGANIGFHSLSLKNNFPNQEVYSFEPDFRNFERLKLNKHLNRLNVNLMNFALSDQIDCAQIYSMAGNNGMSSLAPWHEFNWENDPHYILTVTGDYLIEKNLAASPSVIKLDVEGYELQVLQGLQKTLASRKVRKIVFEAGSDFLETESEIKTLLSNFGYYFEKLNRKVEGEHHTLDNFSAFL